MSIVYNFDELNDNYNNYKYGPKKEVPAGTLVERAPLPAPNPYVNPPPSPQRLQDEVRTPTNIQKLIFSINQIMRKADEKADLVWNIDSKSFRYKNKVYSIETFFDPCGGVALIDPPAYLKFENGEWVNVYSSGAQIAAGPAQPQLAQQLIDRGYKQLANGDIQHDSIGRNQTYDPSKITASGMLGQQVSPQQITAAQLANGAKLNPLKTYNYDPVNQTYMELIDKHNNNLKVFKK